MNDPIKRSKFFPFIGLIFSAFLFILLFCIGEFYFRHQVEARCLFDSSTKKKNVMNLDDYFCQAADPHLNFRMQSNMDISLLKVQFKTNSDGFRGPEFDLDTDTDNLRILGIGDSVMAG
jgi:hypothetical protein